MMTKVPASSFRPCLRLCLFALSCFAFSACGGDDPDQDASTGEEDDDGKGPGGIDSVGGSEGDGSKQPSEEDGPLPETPEASIRTIRIEPTDTIVRMDLKKEETIPFKAIALYDNGDTKDITSKVEWSIDSKKLGSFDGEELTLKAQSKFAVKSSMIRASYETSEGVGQVTLAAYKRSGDSPDFLFILPYEEKGKNKKSSDLRFATAVPALDVFFDVDTSSSMEDEMNALSQSLEKEIVPQIQSKVKNTQFGVGSFEDFPVRPHGAPKGAIKRADQPFSLKQIITKNVSAVQKGVDSLTLGRGGDVPESALESLYQIATGSGLSGPGETMVPANKDGLGGVGFRKGTMPVIVAITDAVSHAPGETDDGCERDYTSSVKAVAHTRKETEEALEKACARVIYVASAGVADEVNPQCSPETDGVALAKATGARVFPAVWNKNRPKNCMPGQCCTGIAGRGKPPEQDGRCSLVYNVDAKGNGLGSTVVSGIEALAFYAQFDVTMEKKGETESVDGVELPDDHTTLDFISAITADKSGDPPIEGLPKPKPAGDHFEDVTPGTEVQFKIEAVNDFLPEEPGKVQVFQAELKVKADQCEGLELDTREVHFIIPPAPIAPPV